MENTAILSFGYAEFDADGLETVTVERNVYDSDTDVLSKVLTAFTYFLHGIGFNCVRGIVAQCGDAEHASE